MKIYGFYHICLMDGWSNLVEEQINSLIESGLYDKSDTIFISLLGNKENQEKCIYLLKQIDSDRKIDIIIKNKDFQSYEQQILNYLRVLSENEEFYCYYFHTKGISINESNKTWYHGSTDLIHLKNCVNDWRKFMEYFLFYKNSENIKLLENYDCCGVNYVEEPHKCFSGNFWWSKSDYIKTLKILPDIKDNRWLAEFWIGSGVNTKFKNHITTNAGYMERVEKDKYVNNIIENSAVTFIIPTINRNTLNRSIESLLNQTNKNWFCKVIFDGVEPINFNDDRIESVKIEKIGLIHDEHGQAGLVRNVGIDLVETNWIAFLDDDDTINNNYVDILLSQYFDKDFVVFKMKYENGFILPKGKEITFGNVGISFAYKKILNIKFESNKNGEDFDFINDLKNKSDNYIVSDYIMYNVRH